MSSRISSTRRMLAIASIVIGGVLLAAIPLYMVFLAVSGPESAHLPGTWVILTSVIGMGLVAVGSALSE